MTQPANPSTIPGDGPATNLADPGVDSALALIAPFGDDPGYRNERIALAQVHALLAIADAVDSLDTAVRDLHETLRGGRPS